MLTRIPRKYVIAALIVGMTLLTYAGFHIHHSKVAHAKRIVEMPKTFVKMLPPSVKKPQDFVEKPQHFVEKSKEFHARSKEQKDILQAMSPPSGSYNDICFLNVRDEKECKQICHYDTMCFYSYYYPSRSTANCFTQLFFKDSEPKCQFQNISGAILQNKNVRPGLINTYEEKYIIDTPKCHKPNYHPFDQSLKDITVRSYVTKNFPCKLKNHKKRFQVDSSDHISLLGETSKEESCRYRYIYRDDGYKENDEAVDYTDWFPLTKEPKELTGEFLEITCERRKSQTYQDYYSRVPIALAKARAEKATKRRKDGAKSRRFPEDKLSVLLFGIDSTSLSQGYRQLPRILGYFKEEMDMITVKGYNRIQDNTFMNIYTVLTGKPILEDVGISMFRFFDDDPLLYKWFKNDGFVTGYYEDYKTGALFNWLKKGFHYSPSDHYSKPFAVRVESTVAKNWARDFCYMDKGVYTWVGNWTASLAKKYASINHQYFVYSWTTLLSHEYLNTLGYGDLYYYELFKDLHESGALNKTILLFYSDHGYRYGGLRATKVGQHEENNPMMHWIIPKWFQKKYSKEMEVFRKNADNRLTTPYDIHRTLLDFADGALESATAAGMEKFGKSLFEPIDKERTCADAGIPDHYCDCRHALSQPITDDLTKLAAQAIVDRINVITSTEQEKCLRYTLRYIQVAYRNYRHDINDDDLVELVVTVGVKPSTAEFSASVHIFKSNKKPAEVKGISRVSLYSNTADCVNDFRLRLYCSCKGLVYS